jgi:hypothetical protein
MRKGTRKLKLGAEVVRELSRVRGGDDPNRVCSTATIGTGNTVQQVCSVGCTGNCPGPSSPELCGPGSGGC